MNNNDLRLHGWSLVAASLGLIVTLMLHPSEHGLLDPAQVEAVGRKMVLAHSLALGVLPLWFFGAIGIARRLGVNGWAGLGGLVLHGFAMLAMMNALVVDGLVTPGLAREIVRAKPAPAIAWKVAFNHNALLDGAFMKLAIVALAAGMVVWSLGMMRGGKFALVLGICGLVLGVATMGCQFAGLTSQQPHVFMLILLGQILWFLGIGVSLARHEAAR